MSKLDRCSLLAGDECTSLAELREQNEELQVQVAGMREVIEAVAKAGLMTTVVKGVEYDTCLFMYRGYKEKAQALLSTPTAGEWVVVKVVDLKVVLEWLTNLALFEALHIPRNEADPELVESVGRLRAALKGGEE